MLIRSQPLLSEKIFFWGLLLLTIGLPTSVFLMSLGGISLGAAWILQGNYKEALRISFNDRLVLLFTGLFLLHIIGLIWTEDFNYALRDIKIKLPLLIYPVVLSALPALNRKNFSNLLLLFIAAVFVSTLISFGVYLKIIPTSKDLSDIRNISPFISHIRLSLMVCLSIVLSVYFVFTAKKKLRFGLIPLILWFLYFLSLLESVTAFVILGVVLVLVNVYWIFTNKNTWIKLGGGLAFLSLTLIFTYTVFQTYQEIRTPKESFSDLHSNSIYGEIYDHDLSTGRMENGYYTGINIAPGELKNTWNERSKIHFDSTDQKEQHIAETIIRYMTSKGLKKDREGVLALTEQDIHHIEEGYASINYVTKSGMRRRVEQLIFEMESFLYGSDVSKNSVARRIIFWKHGWEIFKKNKWLGVGTGDAQLAFNDAYLNSGTSLNPSEWKRSHNQFLAMMVSFGILGLIVFSIFVFYPMIHSLKNKNYLYLLFSIIVTVSYFSEDTLESQPGITFIMYFSSLFLFLSPLSRERK